MFAAVLGWAGAGGTFVAYLLASRGLLAVDSRRYAALNVVGGLMGATASTIYGAWPSVASNLVWAAIGLCSLLLVRRDAPRPLAAEPVVAEPVAA